MHTHLMRINASLISRCPVLFRPDLFHLLMWSVPCCAVLCTPLPPLASSFFPLGIALNQALSENLFVTIICILNKIPIFIVGKPGTSKTLAIQIIASNLQGTQSPKRFWRLFPAVYIFQYQCSPLSTAASIQFQFEAAKSYQEHSQDVLTGEKV